MCLQREQRCGDQKIEHKKTNPHSQCECQLWKHGLSMSSRGVFGNNQRSCHMGNWLVAAAFKAALLVHPSMSLYRSVTFRNGFMVFATLFFRFDSSVSKVGQVLENDGKSKNHGTILEGQRPPL